MKNTKYITVEQAAWIIGVDGSQVRRYCRAGDLPAIRFGRAWMIREVDARKYQRRPVGNPNFIRE